MAVKTIGSWIVRCYQGKPGEYDSKAFAQTDDFSDIDGSSARLLNRVRGSRHA